MLRRNYKNYLHLRDNPDPKERRENLTKEALKDVKFLPEPVTYEDIDQAMMEWSNKELDLSIEGEDVPTIALYTNQRFEEYMQNWQHSDNKNNMLLNFKTIGRENNPKIGTINGQNSWNIPCNRFYTIRRERVIDKNGQISYMNWEMKQPFSVDLKYKISLVTGKYEFINQFNTLAMDIFKSGYSYVHIKGHYMSLKMEEATDESEYSIDDRRYFAQTISLTLKAYIILPEDLRVEETPKLTFHCEEGIDKPTKINVNEDDDSVVEDDGLYYKPLTLTVNYDKCGYNEIKTRIPYNMVVKEVVQNNVKTFNITIDGEEISTDDDFMFQEAELTKIIIKRNNPLIEASLIFNGYDKDTIYDENLEEEDEFEDTQKAEELTI